MMPVEVYVTESESETQALGAAFLLRCRVGDVVALSGPLGAGKTAFVRGAVRAAGERGTVRSPTFQLMHRYESDPPILHADLYRLESAVTGGEFGLEDELDVTVAFIEWPERRPALFKGERATWWVEFRFAGNDAREIEIRPPSDPDSGP